MPILLLIASYFGFSLSAETLRITSKVLRVGAFVVVAIALTAALIAGFNAALSTVSVALPNEVLVVAVSLLPSNATACISVVLSARIARFVYDWNVRIADKLSD
jgi:hypothetical protein